MSAVAAAPELLERLRAVGDERYHDKHPFHRKLVAGALTPDQVRSWVANRYAYQKAIPIKDAYILAHLPSREYRRAWIKRIYDHDGTPGESEGGTLQWLALGRAVGISEDEMNSERGVSAGARFAAEAYVDFCRMRPWLEAVAASLTELFGPPVMERRVSAIVEQYPWIDPEGLAYFRKRIVLAPADAQQALSWVLEHARSPEQQDACVAALRFKCDVLWCLLDATALASGVFV